MMNTLNFILPLYVHKYHLTYFMALVNEAICNSFQYISIGLGKIPKRSCLESINLESLQCCTQIIYEVPFLIKTLCWSVHNSVNFVFASVCLITSIFFLQNTMFTTVLTWTVVFMSLNDKSFNNHNRSI